MSAATSTQPRIAIVGGGLGGLALLLTLHRRGVSATLYERDTSFDARAHVGANLDLGWTSGQRALRENGLQEEFDKNSDKESGPRGGRKIYDGTGTLHLSRGGEGHQGSPPPERPEDLRPEIDRTVLRKILLDAIPPHLIKWDHALSSACSLGRGQHELTFANGFVTTCDFLVGADGANSRVRPLVSPATPAFTGVNCVEISLAPETTKLPELAETIAAVGQGTVLAMQNSRMLGARVNRDGRLRTLLFFRETVPSAPAEAKAALKMHFAGWAPWMLNLIDYADESTIYHHPVYILPVGHTWTHVPGVTLIGDAAHLMSSFAGAGANLALLDGLELGLALAQFTDQGKFEDAAEVTGAVAAFEEQMCAMAGRLAEMADGNLREFVGPNTPQAAIARFRELATQGGEREG